VRNVSSVWRLQCRTSRPHEAVGLEDGVRENAKMRYEPCRMQKNSSEHVWSTSQKGKLFSSENTREECRGFEKISFMSTKHMLSAASLSSQRARIPVSGWKRSCARASAPSSSSRRAPKPGKWAPPPHSTRLVATAARTSREHWKEMRRQSKGTECRRMMQ
jgi:hypothetical protein